MRLVFITICIFISSIWRIQAQSTVGKVTDSNGKPLANVLVEVVNQDRESSLTNEAGEYTIKAAPNELLSFNTTDGKKQMAKVKSAVCNVVIANSSKTIERGFGIQTNQHQSTLAASTANYESIEKFSAQNPENALYGILSGLAVLSNGGPVYNSRPTLQLRGVGTTANATPLILVDGVDRLLQRLSVSEIESVTVLKDAAAVALYGIRGANGVILVTTKRGEYGSMKIDVKYQHGLYQPFRMHKMADAPTYAQALNEALVNDGFSPRFTDAEIDLFRNGSSPYLYPNVDWLKESTKEYGNNNELDLSFRGGSKNVRYFSAINYSNDFGLMNPVPSIDGYNTSLNYYRLNLRSNLDIRLFPTTMLKVNLMGSIDHYNRPGIAPNTLFQRISGIPSAAFPIKTENNIWGGNQIYTNTNPVANIAASGYVRSQNRVLYSDLTLTQDLSALLRGLSAEVGVSYDNMAEYMDTYSRTFQYEYGGAKYGQNSDISFSKSLNSMYMNSALYAKLNHFFKNDTHQLNTLLLYNQEDYQTKTRNSHIARQSIIASASWAMMDRYFVDVTANLSGSSYLPKGDKFRFYPAVSAGWLLSSESFMESIQAINSLKLRASFGLSGNDLMEYELDKQFYVSGGNYWFGNQSVINSSLKEGALATENLQPELSKKVNVGIDLTAFNALQFSVDAFYDYRTNILVSGGNVISSVVGVGAPKLNTGIVENKGIETSIAYHGQVGAFKYGVSGQFSYTKNKIVENGEGYKPYDYMYNRGNSIGTYYGLVSAGMFRDQADIAASFPQSFSILRPGDVKYVDQNGDQEINEYDVRALGYSTRYPEIYYGFTLSGEYKGFGVSAQFQGVDNIQVIRNTENIYWTLRNNGNISEWYYNNPNRWTPDNRDGATLPRLTTQDNANNFRASDVWMADGAYLKLRALELSYNLALKKKNKASLRNVKLFVRGMNLFSIDAIKDMDPEYLGNQYPTLSSYHAGVQISF